MELIVLLGQTSTGKSQMAVDLAKNLGNTWIVGCDSRQIYENLNLGTGKIEGKWETINGLKAFYWENIPHFLIDYLDPFKSKIPHSLNNYIQDFNNLFKTDKLPKYVILTGGTGLYAKTIYNKTDLGIVKEGFIAKYESFKEELKKLELGFLQQKLSKDFPDVKLNNSDFNNPRRLVSNILKQTSIKENWVESTSYPQFIKTSLFAIKTDNLNEKISTRILNRIQKGLIEEVKDLQNLGIENLLNLGLEYRLICLYFLGFMNFEGLTNKLIQGNLAYAKRQYTWLKKEPLIWIKSVDEILKTLI